MSDPLNYPHSDKEWKLVEKVLLQAQEDNRKSRRWGHVFKLLGLGYLLLITLVFSLPLMMAGSGGGVDAGEEHTAVVDVDGVIAVGAPAGADALITALRGAFEAEFSKAVVLRINSPGGSPVQSGYVYDEIVRLRALYPDKRLYAVIRDVGASGAYYMAAAADEIYVDKASIVGSIGVIMSGFGFTDAIEKLGVERRVLTAGENKAVMDPFSPLASSDQAHMQDMLNEIHQQFIEVVKTGRGERLSDSPDIFSGLFWTGEQAVALGLADGLGSASSVARDIVEAEDLVDYTLKPSPFERFAESLGTQIGIQIGLALGSDGVQLR